MVPYNVPLVSSTESIADMSQSYTSCPKSVVLDDIYSLTSNATLFNDMMDIAANIEPNGDQNITFDLEEARVLITRIYQHMIVRRKGLRQMGALEPPKEQRSRSRVSRWVQDQDEIFCSRSISNIAFDTVADLCLLAAFDRNPILQALYCNFLPHKCVLHRTRTPKQLKDELKQIIRGALHMHLAEGRGADSHGVEAVKMIAEVWLDIATMLIRTLCWRHYYRFE